jgi:HK97 family phage major capsid protein
MATVLQPDRRTRLTEQIDLLAKRTNVRLGAAEEARRDLTPDEQAAHDREIAEITRLTSERARLAADDDMMAVIEGLGRSDDVFAELQHGGTSRLTGRRRSLGHQFVQNDAMAEWLKRKPWHGTGAWRSPAVELQAAVLTSDPASGGALVVPQYQPGILPTPLRQPTVAELLADGQATSNLVAYMQETLFDNKAAAVGEGGVKPESALTFALVNEAVKKVAHWLPVTDELLEDVPALASYINRRLIAGVRVALDMELLSGSGVAPHFLGLLNRPGLTPALPQGTMTAADAIATQIANISMATEGVYLPDAIVLNPADWSILRLAKTTDGAYLSGGPFQQPGTPVLWGLPVVMSSAIAVGTALIGAFKTAAQFFLRGGITTEASNSHADFFVKDLVAIRSEVRGALAVYRPQAFGTVTGLTAASGA